MNQTQIANLAVDLMHQHGVMQRGWTFGFDRAKRRFGQANFTRKRITLSREFIGLRTEAQIRNTILHEIAHVLAGIEAGHGPEWRRIARSIGCDGKRCSDTEGSPTPRYVGVCAKGHVGAKFYRAVKRTYSCPTCYPGAFSENHTLKIYPYERAVALGVSI